MSEFDFTVDTKETGWLVKDMIPISHLCIVLAQAGVGKSLLVESLAVHMIYNCRFCELDTAFGDVLIVDQDTPENVITKRLLKFGKAIGGERYHKLYLESMKGYSLSDQSLFKIIKSYQKSNLAIIDSLHSVLGGLNPNRTSDMCRLATLKKECINEHNTIIINHHISEKVSASVTELMLGDPHKLAMGNSAIIQQADTYFIVGATAENGITDRIYIRAVSKRVSIPLKPMVLRVVQSGDGEKIVFDGYYEPDLDEAEKDVITLFREEEKERTVKEVYDAMGHKHGEVKTREALAILEKKGLLLLSRYKSNLFKYRLP